MGAGDGLGRGPVDRTRDPERTWTVGEALGWTTDRLGRHGIASARLDAEVLLAAATGLDRVGLYTGHDRPLNADERARYRELVRRRLLGEPVAYLVGRREFWSLELLVDARVLIPRRETEHVVEAALAALPPPAADRTPLLADIGTGSGAIALAIKRERPDAVLLDVCLPGMSGLDFMKHEAVRRLHVPILVISGRATESQAQEAMRAGAFDFMGKPVALRRLQEALACFEPPAKASSNGKSTSKNAKKKTEESEPERRRAPRAILSLPVRIREQNGAEWESTSVNLSASGIKVRSNGSRRAAGMATLSITLPESETQVEVPSILVRADDEGYSFAFKDHGDERLAELHELVRRSVGAPTVDAESHVRILHRIGEAISATLDVDEVLRIALDALTPNRAAA